MKIETADFLLCRLAYRLPGMLKRLGDMETEQLRDRLEEIPLERPVFITGLARSGTTLLLNIFSMLEGVGTHRYRDFPFLFLPCWWSRFVERAGRTQPEVERPHKDRIKINRESPDAFEEPIWHYFFPFVHDPTASQVLTAQHDNQAFDVFFKDHLRKILLLRGKRRYVSKGNYNLTRLEYLGRLFPDARFVIPIRHPLTHVDSLVRQHRLFSDYSLRDRRVPDYLRAAGHFEFGPQRVPVNVDSATARRVLDAWRRRDDALGYAICWGSVYAYANALAARNTDLAARMRFVRYEDLCGDPTSVLRELLAFCGFPDRVEPLREKLPPISAPTHDARRGDLGGAERIWQEACMTAEAFGYK